MSLSYSTRRQRIHFALLGLSLIGSLQASGQNPPSLEPGEVVERARTKIVILSGPRQRSVGSATGFLTAPGLVATAGHAVEGMASTRAWVNGVEYRAEVVARHPEQDLALLRLQGRRLHLKPLPLAPSTEDLRAGEPLLVLTGPAQLSGTASDPNRRLARPGLFTRPVEVALPDGRPSLKLELRASVERGDSGSPVLRVRDGAVVGILSSRELPDERGVSSLAYAVPIDALLPWIRAADRGRRPEPREGFYLERAREGR